MHRVSIGIAISVAAGIALGLAGGSFVTGGVDHARLLEARADTLAPWRGRAVAEAETVTSYTARPSSVAFDPIAAACSGCSDYELGYRWAASGGASSTVDCEAYSWSYERGCLAWLRDRGNRGT